LALDLYEVKEARTQRITMDVKVYRLEFNAGSSSGLQFRGGTYNGR
jgi:hypothetical protein